MESPNLFSKEEQARTWERVFEIFARTQENWAIEHYPDNSPGDMDKPGRNSPTAASNNSAVPTARRKRSKPFHKKEHYWSYTAG